MRELWGGMGGRRRGTARRFCAAQFVRFDEVVRLVESFPLVLFELFFLLLLFLPPPFPSDTPFPDLVFRRRNLSDLIPPFLHPTPRPHGLILLHRSVSGEERIEKGV